MESSRFGADEEMKESMAQSGEKVSPKKRRGKKKDMRSTFNDL
jgi:hypothetical protein